VLDRLGLRATLVDRAFLNVPPAAVYRLTRRPQMKFVAGSVAPAISLPLVPGSGAQAGRQRTIA
jgi:hypothetical protein